MKKVLEMNGFFWICVRLAGITVFLSIIGKKCPASYIPYARSTETSVPSVKEHTSVRITSFTALCRSFIAACIASWKLRD